MDTGVMQGSMSMGNIGSPYGPYPEITSGKLLKLENPLHDEMKDGARSVTDPRAGLTPLLPFCPCSAFDKYDLDDGGTAPPLLDGNLEHGVGTQSVAYSRVLSLRSVGAGTINSHVEMRTLTVNLIFNLDVSLPVKKMDILVTRVLHPWPGTVTLLPLPLSLCAL